MDTHKIGFIGQGFIGKNLADDFAERGYETVRYAKEVSYAGNREAVAGCDIVFVAVPTPTTPEGFDDSILRAVLTVPKAGAVVVIKSTILPGTTKLLREDFPELTLLHSPEFLREKYAREDTRRPERTIVGMPHDDALHRRAAEQVLAILPDSPYQLICDSTEAELVKYGGNCFLMLKLVFMNVLYDLAEAHGVDYEKVKHAMAADPRIGPGHMNVVDSSGHPGANPGRGAGGHCFPKDWAALREQAEAMLADDAEAIALLKAVESKNNALLRGSAKDLDLLAGIYGA